MADLRSDISSCTLCGDQFAATATGHRPRPVVWFSPKARILIASQAPGMRAHESRTPFKDPSGDRLRAWMGLDEAVFYDRSRIAIVPMAFCFPGYSATGSDLPPPVICANTWRSAALEMLPNISLTLIIGAYAMKYHLSSRTSVTEAVRQWDVTSNDSFVLPHPSWRNTGWLKKNPWFETDVIPRLQARIRDVLND